MDVTSHTLGVELRRNRLGTLIPKSTPIPCKAKRVYSTPYDNQTSVPIRVLEGESANASSNRTLALFQLRGLPKQPRGEPQIEVTFEMDSNGILQVTAKDQATGKSQEVEIRESIGLERSEIEKLRKTCDEFEKAEVVQKVQIDLHNHAERVLGDVAKWFEFNHAMMPKKTQIQIAVALDKLERKLRGRDIVALKAALKRLDRVVLPLRKAG